MRKEYLMIELLNAIKDTQAKMEGLYKKYISPDSKSRSMVSIYNENSNMTVNGARAVDVCKEIEQINDDIVSTTEKLRSLTAIKEQINSTCRTKIIDLDGNTVEYTISQLLMISSPKIKKYHLDYLNKLEKDYQDALLARSVLSKSIMTEEKISMYVTAKMNSLRITDDPDKVTYGALAKEYREANRLDLLDPLDIQHDIEKRKKNADDYYSRIRIALSTFNATTKVWIYCDESGQYTWGLVESEHT